MAGRSPCHETGHTASTAGDPVWHRHVADHVGRHFGERVDIARRSAVFRADRALDALVDDP